MFLFTMKNNQKLRYAAYSWRDWQWYVVLLWGKKRKSTNCEPTFKCHVLSGANSWIVARHIGHSASCTTQEEQKPLWPQGSSRTDALLSKHRVHESSRTLSFRNCSRWMCLPGNRTEKTKTNSDSRTNHK